MKGKFLALGVWSAILVGCLPGQGVVGVTPSATAPAPALPDIPVTLTALPQTGPCQALVITSDVQVLRNPLDPSQSLGTAERDKAYPVSGKYRADYGTAWFQIAFESQTGWIPSEYGEGPQLVAVTQGDCSAVPEINVTAGSVVTPTDDGVDSPPMLMIDPSDPPGPAAPVTGVSPGLIVTNSDSSGSSQTWMLNKSGELENIPARGDISPDGTHMLYEWGGDIWLADRITGEQRRLTATPDRLDRFPEWLPGNANGFICLSKPAATAEEDLFLLGYLTYAGFAGEYEVLLPDTPLYDLPAPAPDGQTIAYVGTDGTLWLYRMGAGPEQLTWADTGLGSGVVRGISWSPDGRKIGLVLTKLMSGETGILLGIGVLDVETRILTLLHTFEPVGSGAPVDSMRPQWSPDGQWLVFSSWGAVDPADDGLWLADEAGVRRLSEDSARGTPTALVSPDGAWVAATQASGDLVLFRAGEWQPIIWDMPGHALLVDWVTPP